MFIMNNRVKLYGLATLFVTVSTILIFSNVAWSDSDRDKDYCYDQVGDGHFCFDTKKKCKQEQKSDEIAESPCYNKDLN